MKRFLMILMVAALTFGVVEAAPKKGSSASKQTPKTEQVTTPDEAASGDEATENGGGAYDKAKQNAQNLDNEQKKTKSLWDLFSAGGWLMWVLLLLGGVTIFIFVERFVAIRRASALDMNFMNRIRDYILDGKVGAAVDLCRRENTPIARMIEKGIERLGRPMSDVQTAIENVANLEVSKLENGLPFLATIAGGAPMIGFLGTVLGMVQTFMDMSVAGGTVDMSLLSGGMYVAMVTTVGGLIVGIPAYFGYNYLVARIEKLVFRMEANSIAFMDILNQPVQK